MKLLLCAALSACLSATGAAAATLTFFQDRAAFAVAAGPATTETFNGVSHDVSLIGAPVRFGALSVSALGFSGAPRDNNIVDAPGFSGFDRNVDGTPYLLLRQTAGGQSFDFAFDGPVFAVGFDYRDLNPGRRGASVALDGMDVFGFRAADAPASGFFGVVSDTAFTTLTLGREFRDFTAGIDNVTFAGAAQVIPTPLPASAAFALAGLAALAVIGRRRR